MLAGHLRRLQSEHQRRNLDLFLAVPNAWILTGARRETTEMKCWRRAGWFMMSIWSARVGAQAAPPRADHFLMPHTVSGGIGARRNGGPWRSATPCPITSAVGRAHGEVARSCARPRSGRTRPSAADRQGHPICASSPKAARPMLPPTIATYIRDRIRVLV